jgi:hypothetical protein
VISPPAEESIDSVNAMAARAQEEIMAEAQASGRIVAMSREPVWSVIYGSDGCGHVEVITQYDPADPESVLETRKIVEKADAKVAEWGLGINLLENALSFERHRPRPRLLTASISSSG